MKLHEQIHEMCLQSLKQEPSMSEHRPHQRIKFMLKKIKP